MNSLNSILGIIDNFKNTFHLENMSKFADKDISYKEKVAYAKEVSKTVATIYGGYKVGTSVYDKITNINTSGTIQGYGSTDKILNASLSKSNSYNGQIISPHSSTMFTILTYQNTLELAKIKNSYTVDVNSKGIMTTREARAVQSIMQNKPNDMLITIPKNISTNELKNILDEHLK